MDVWRTEYNFRGNYDTLCSRLYRAEAMGHSAHMKRISVGTVMKVNFRSKDFASVTSAGLGFNNRRPMASSWHYQGRVQHRDWQGTYECYWDGADAASTVKKSPSELVWIVSGDARLFALAAALKVRGFPVEIEQE